MNLPFRVSRSFQYAAAALTYLTQPLHRSVYKQFLYKENLAI